MGRSKADLRKEKLRLRKHLSFVEVDEYSHIISNKLFGLNSYKLCNSLLIYSDYNNEVKTKKIINKAFEDNKKVYLPRVCGEQMDFYQINSTDELIPGTMGILEPQAIEENRFNGDEFTLVVIPLSVFDRFGNRIGYGGGYYDKYLSRMNEVNKIGLAYSFQEVNLVPSEITDIKLDSIITENEIIEVKTNG